MYSTDYRKRLYVDGNIRYKSIMDLHRQDEYTAGVRPTFRASDRLSHLNHNYFDNLGDVLGQPQINTFSLKILYYLDYQSLQRRL